MIGLLRDLTDWVKGFADSDWSALALGINSFTEAIIFPVPPDPLLVAIAVLEPDKAFWLAALTTITSVAGAVVGHWLGRRLGRPLLYRMFDESKVESVERMFKRYGAWAVFLAALTPVPYKVFAIASGALGLNMRTFIAASLIGRGLRFFTIGAVAFVYGDAIESFVTAKTELVALVVVIALILLGVAAVIIRRRWAATTLSRARPPQ